MTKRLGFIWGFAAVVAVAFPVSGGAQTPQRITVEYFDASLRQVLRNFATYIGRAIVMAPDIGDPAITVGLFDVDWQTGLDRILASQGLVARSDSSGLISVERSRRITVEYLDATLRDVIRAFSSFTGRTFDLPANVATLKVTATARDVDWQRALDDILATHALVAREDGSGTIRIGPR